MKAADLLERAIRIVLHDGMRVYMENLGLTLRVEQGTAYEEELRYLVVIREDPKSKLAEKKTDD